LNSFDGKDGDDPPAPPIQATDGNFYGTTYYGGAHGENGTVFRITPSGMLTSLYSFDSTHGANPLGGLVQGANGNFYGTTQGGGRDGIGTIFGITPKGTLATLHSFDETDGAVPQAGLTLGSDGNFYGTTTDGGAYDGNGTVFKITPKGALTTIYNFCPQTGCPDGGRSYTGLVLGTDGNFYGTTEFGGAYGFGTVFQITPDGTLTTLHSYDVTDGQDSEGLIQDTNGALYGTTETGGAYGDGTVFSLSVGLGPFVKTNPAAGKVGATVGILGTNLTGATGVKFNGTATAFRVVSKTFIEAKVPSGATTGKVTVQLPSGALSSNVPFILLR